MERSQSKSQSQRQSDEKLIANFAHHLVVSFPRLTYKTHVPLKELFQEPDNPTLKRFWNCSWSHADIAVFRHGKLVCIIEPGGHQHITDAKQNKRDHKKYLICKQAGVNMLSLMNRCMNHVDHPKFRRLLKAYFYKNSQ